VGEVCVSYIIYSRIYEKKKQMKKKEKNKYFLVDIPVLKTLRHLVD